MIYNIPLSPVVSQIQTFELLGHNLQLKVMYNVSVGGLTMDLFDTNLDEYVVQNYGLAVGCPSLVELNLDYVFVLIDRSPIGMNIVSVEELGDRIALAMVSKDEWFQTIRSVIRT